MELSYKYILMEYNIYYLYINQKLNFLTHLFFINCKARIMLSIKKKKKTCKIEYYSFFIKLLSY